MDGGRWEPGVSLTEDVTHTQGEEAAMTHVVMDSVRTDV